jgi:hypothetical protein
MKLNELLDRESITSVSDRTNISIDILLKLVDGDFEELSRVRALGFVSILKREYEIEFDELEKSIKEHFKESIIEDNNKSVLVTVDKKDGDTSYFKWIIIVALLGGLWHLYNSGQLGGNLSNNTNKENRLEDSEILKSTTTENDAKESVIVTKNKNKTEVKIETATSNKDIIIEDKTINKDELNKSREIELNKTIESNISNREKTIVEQKEENIDINDSSAEIEEILDENIEESTNETIKKNKLSINTPVNDEDIVDIIYNVTVNPRVNLWFGFINIDTKERKEFMTTQSTAIDVGEQRWILMTGHGRVTVASDSKTLKIDDRVKHYFYIDSSEMREIKRKEFKSLNDGRGW